MQNIQEIREKGKQLLADDAVFFSLLILLVGVVAFGLGRMAVAEYGDQPATIIMSDATGDETQMAEQYVGSKNSDKYHALWCSGAERISEENKIWFDSKVDAEAAGYEPAGNCPGLEE